MSGAAFHDYTVFDDGLLWNASLELLKYLKTLDNLKGKRVIELGSGLGHLGLAIAELGADVTLTEHSSVLGSLQDRVAAYGQKHPHIKARAVELEWGEEGWGKSPIAQVPEPYDIIISAELLGV